MKTEDVANTEWMNQADFLAINVERLTNKKLI